jgi:serine O-acetyltransferase
VLFENLRADINENAKWNTTPTLGGKLALILDTGFHAVVVYRFGAWIDGLRIPGVRHILLIIYKLLHLGVHLTSTINICKEAKIGKGLALHSYSGNYISRVEMGEYCVLAPDVYIVGRKDGVPKIGNRVFFGIGCKVLGKVTIGDDAIIGAGALVMKDVPANHTAIGVDNLKIYPNKIEKGDRFKKV